jgi:hypothetical protein|nr:MAG TPA: hypothetical protein [Caudoviricetes sp.]
MKLLMTEAVGRITYGPHEPTTFMLSNDLLETYLGDRVYVRVGDKRYHILALNTLVATGEVEIECEEVD